MSRAERRVFGVWLALLTFFVYGSWVPMVLVPRELGDAWQAFMARPLPTLRGVSRADVAVNVMLTVPIAFGAVYLVASITSRLVRGLLYGLLAPALVGMSVGVEFMQMFFAQRSASWTDVTAQILGSALGALAYWIWGARVRALVAELSDRLPPVRRLQRLLLIYCALLVAWQLMP